MVLAVSAIKDGDLIDETGDATDWAEMEGDFNGRIGCIGSWTCCTCCICCTGVNCCCVWNCACCWCWCWCCCCCCACCCALSRTGLYLLLFLNIWGHVLLSGPRCPLSFLSLSAGCCGGYGCIFHLVHREVEGAVTTPRQTRPARPAKAPAVRPRAQYV
jgi:hypothetical protein